MVTIRGDRVPCTPKKTLQSRSHFLLQATMQLFARIVAFHRTEPAFIGTPKGLPDS